MQDAVGVYVESDLDLRRATRSGRYAFKVELAQRLVACSDFTLALEHLDGDRGLVVVSRREHLREPGGYGGVLLDHLGHDTAQGFDTQGQRRDVQQQHVGAITRQYRALDGRTGCNSLVRVDVLARILAEEFLDLLLDLVHARHATHQEHVVDVRHFDTGVLDGDAAWLYGAVDKLFNQRFQLGARHLEIKVLGTGSVRRNIRQVDLGLLRGRQFDLGFFRRFFQALQGQDVLGEVHSAFFLELANDVVDDALVEVFAAEESIAVGGQYLELLFAIDVSQLDDGNVEGTAAQVIDRNFAIALFGLVHTEGQSRCSRFVDDALDVQAGNAAGILGGLTLTVVEVGGHGNDSLGDFFTQVVFGRFLHFAQHVRRDLRRSKLFALRFYPCIAVVGLDDGVRHELDVFLHGLLVELATDKALDGV